MLIDNQNTVDPLRSVKIVIDIQENQIKKLKLKYMVSKHKTNTFGHWGTLPKESLAL